MGEEGKINPVDDVAKSKAIEKVTKAADEYEQETKFGVFCKPERQKK